MPFRYIKTD